MDFQKCADYDFDDKEYIKVSLAKQNICALLLLIKRLLLFTTETKSKKSPLYRAILLTCACVCVFLGCKMCRREVIFFPSFCFFLLFFGLTVLADSVSLIRACASRSAQQNCTTRACVLFFYASKDTKKGRESNVRCVFSLFKNVERERDVRAHPKERHEEGTKDYPYRRDRSYLHISPSHLSLSLSLSYSLCARALLLSPPLC